MVAIGRGSWLFQSDSDPRIGALNVPPYFDLPRLPNIVAEWASIIPLVSHLASRRTDHHLVGQLALQGRLSPGLFPKLGTLQSIAHFLTDPAGFNDRASTKGGSVRIVWDVNWGSVFPSANGEAGAAITAVSERATGDSEVFKMPETIPQPLKSLEGSSTPTKPTENHSLPVHQMNIQATKVQKGSQGPHRRYQTLHIHRFRRRPARPSLHERLEQLYGSPWLQLATFIVSLVAIVFLGLAGSYGTAVTLAVNTVSLTVAKSIPIARPPGYMDNNEASNNACMLVATHQNSNDWYLFIGDRAIVDGILNKSMIMLPSNPYLSMAASWFQLAHILQLLAMTFVAAQKGWDGVCLVIVMALDWCWRQQFGYTRLVRSWMYQNEVEVLSKTFLFTGRMAMLGSIQVFSGSKVASWMDDIISPHPRRHAWFDCLMGKSEISDLQRQGWSEHDAQNIEISSQLAIASAKILTKEMASEVA
jgi:hypothetical protein